MLGENNLKCCSRMKTDFQVSQYQNFSIPYDGEEYSITLKAEPAENIADNGGTRAMFRAYERLPEERKECVPGFNFTSDQLFWVVFHNSSAFRDTYSNCFVFSDRKLILFLYNIRRA